MCSPVSMKWGFFQAFTMGPMGRALVFVLFSLLGSSAAATGGAGKVQPLDLEWKVFS